MPVWIVYVELEPCEAYRNGAFVECYVDASEIREAISIAIEALEDSNFEVAHVSKCIEFEEDEWDDENDPDNEVRLLAAQAQQSDDVLTGPFQAWEYDDDE